MDDHDLRHCECRCPCHRQIEFDPETSEKSDPMDEGMSWAQGPIRSVVHPEVTCPHPAHHHPFGEEWTANLHHLNDNNPFRPKTPKAHQVLSTSFLYVKGLVKNMTAQYESLCESQDGVARHLKTNRNSFRSENCTCVQAPARAELATHIVERDADCGREDDEKVIPSEISKGSDPPEEMQNDVDKDSDCGREDEVITLEMSKESDPPEEMQNDVEVLPENCSGETTDLSPYTNPFALEVESEPVPRQADRESEEEDKAVQVMEGNCEVENHSTSGNISNEGEGRIIIALEVNKRMNDGVESDSESGAGPNDEILGKLCKDYEKVQVVGPNVHVEPIGRSTSVTNISRKEDSCEENSENIRRSSTEKRGSFGSGGEGKAIVFRTKRQYCICDKCRKIVDMSETAFHLPRVVWHKHCFTCHICSKPLSEKDHCFYEDEPYCLEHYIRAARIPTCSQCHQLILDSTYTSAGGSSWHRHCFACHECREPLVDVKYVLGQNHFPYCLHCHSSNFQKRCKGCQQQILPQEPFVQVQLQHDNGSGLFFHFSKTCLHCSTCEGDLVGKPYFFKKDGNLYCNKYCAVH